MKIYIYQIASFQLFKKNLIIDRESVDELNIIDFGNYFQTQSINI